MSRATPSLRVFAERLIAHEAKENRSAGSESPSIFPVPAKLRPYLTTFMGNAGYHALLTRALSLAAAEVPWLRAVQVKADGSLPGLDELAAPVAPKDIFEGRVVLLTQLLGLLVAFIGENLTVRLVQEVWPKLKLPASVLRPQAEKKK